MLARACNLPVVLIYIYISAYNTYFYTLELIGKTYTTNTTIMSVYNNDRQISTKQRGCNVVVECECVNIHKYDDRSVIHHHHILCTDSFQQHNIVLYEYIIIII